MAWGTGPQRRPERSDTVAQRLRHPAQRQTSAPCVILSEVPSGGVATLLRGFATINYWAADLVAAKRWNADVLGVEPYFERAELDGRIIGPDDPDYQRASLGYVEFRIGDCQHELGLRRVRWVWVGRSAGYPKLPDRKWPPSSV